MNIDLAKLPRATVVSLVAFLVVASLVGWWSWQRVGNAEKSERMLRMRQMQWKGLVASEPAPDAAVAAGIARQVESAEAAVRKLRAQLGAGRVDPIRKEDPPAQRADAFFVLAQFMERQRAAAKSAGVDVPDDAAFSFSAHRNSGPADEYLALVHRQMLVTDGLLSALWQAGPVSLTQVWREDPGVKISSATAARSSSGADWFEWPRERSLARDGILDTLAIRVGFVGRTATLRRFLVEVESLSVPLVVREIEVQPLGAKGEAPGRRRSLEDLFRDESPENTGDTISSSTVPIIPANDAEFVVTLEYLDFVGPAEARSSEQEGSE